MQKNRGRHSFADLLDLPVKVPSHKAGRVAFNPTLGVAQVSTGAAWAQVLGMAEYEIDTTAAAAASDTDTPTAAEFAASAHFTPDAGVDTATFAAGLILDLPDGVARIFAVTNRADSQEPVVVTRGATTSSVDVDQTGVFYTSGAADHLVLLSLFDNSP